MKTAIALLALTGFTSFVIASMRNPKAYKMDMAIRKARDEHMNSAYNYGVPPRLFP